MTTELEAAYFSAQDRSRAAWDAHAARTASVNGRDLSVRTSQLELEACEAELSQVDALLRLNLEDPGLNAIRSVLIGELQKAARAFANAVVVAASLPMPAPLTGFTPADLTARIDALQAFAAARYEGDHTKAIRDRLGFAWAAAADAMVLLTNARRVRRLPAPSRLIQDRPPGEAPPTPRDAAACRVLIDQIKLRSPASERVQLEFRIDELRVKIRNQLDREAADESEAQETRRRRELAENMSTARRHAELVEEGRKIISAAAPLPLEGDA